MIAPLNCPKCGAQCDRDEVDIGVGIQCGPWHCSNSWCGWSESSGDDVLIDFESTAPADLRDFGRWAGMTQDEAEADAAGKPAFGPL